MTESIFFQFSILISKHFRNEHFKKTFHPILFKITFLKTMTTVYNRSFNNFF